MDFFAEIITLGIIKFFDNDIDNAISCSGID